ncbi:hypothetical protein ONS96_010776 [Cadophora gregata f. sp. sojae]|nr:hypothetical protein ONS96_010776 [Cadophora gregata f. sp. sojae]
MEISSIKIPASAETDTNATASSPASKKARTTASKTTKVAKPKKGPACAACRKKKIKCAHRLELGSVTKQPSALPTPELTKKQIKPTSSVNTL